MLTLIILFFITGPIATTTMARAAYRTDCEGELVLHYDELADDDVQQRGDPNPPPAHSP